MTMDPSNLSREHVQALASLLLPYREQVEAAWAGRELTKSETTSRVPTLNADLLTIDMVAIRLSCSRGHVYNLVAAGHLTRRDIGLAGNPKTRVTAASVDDYIARNQKRGVAPA